MSICNTAAWIWAQGYDRPNMFLVAACRKDIPETAAGTWQLEISADSDFALFCERDGQSTCLAFGQFPDYATHKVLERRSLAADTIAGGRLYLLLTSQNADTSTDRKERAGVIFCLRDAEGEIFWRSDADTALFFTRRHRDEGVPLVTGQLGFSFDIDLRMPLCGAPCRVELLSGMPERLLERPVAPLRLREQIPSLCVLSTRFADGAPCAETAYGVRMAKARFIDAGERGDGRAYVFDLGAEQVGFLSLEVQSTRACEVLIGWGEHIADGRVRTDIAGRCFAGRCYVTQGRCQVLYPLRRLGLRYLQINVYADDGEVTVDSASICPVEYPLPDAAPCPVEGGRHAEIYEVCVRTLQHCLHHHYEDCPWREQALYTMDSRNQMLCGYYAWGETAAPRAALGLIARSLREDNLLELCSPARCGITIPAFSAMFAVQLEEYARYSGDLAGAAELLPTAQRIVEGFLRRVDRQTGLLTCYPEAAYWNFYEWLDGLEGKIGHAVAEQDMTYDAPLCCFVSLAVRAVEELCARLGKDDERAILAEAREQLNHAVHTAFFDAEAGVYDSYRRVRDGVRYHRCQLTQALALLCGACPTQEQSRVRAHLANDATLLPVTLSHSIFRYDAMLAEDTYLPQVMQEIECVFGSMLDAGATTFWETAQGESAFGRAGSLCHGWSAVPLYIDWKYAANGKSAPDMR